MAHPPRGDRGSENERSRRTSFERVDAAADLSRASPVADNIAGPMGHAGPIRPRTGPGPRSVRPAGLALSDAVVRELVEGLLRVIADSPDIAERLRSVFSDRDRASQEHLLATKSEYAERAAYSVRQLDQLIKAGLPTVGAGKALRIPIDDADCWVLAHLAPEQDGDDEIAVAALANARRRARRERG